MFQRKIRVEGIIDIFNEKVIVFKVKKDTEIQDDACAETHTVQQFTMCGIFRNQRQQEAERVIEPDADQDDCQVVHIEITIKPQRHTCQEEVGQPVLSAVIQPVPTQKNHRKKYKYEYI